MEPVALYAKPPQLHLLHVRLPLLDMMHTIQGRLAQKDELGVVVTLCLSQAANKPSDVLIEWKKHVRCFLVAWSWCAWTRSFLQV
eukprot:m.106027 g.106027  ORF g.106027 m.106027 type:complete len:85 (+) comp15295_c0_seq5:351-605(+)